MMKSAVFSANTNSASSVYFCLSFHEVAAFPFLLQFQYGKPPQLLQVDGEKLSFSCDRPIFSPSKTASSKRAHESSVSEMKDSQQDLMPAISQSSGQARMSPTQGILKNSVLARPRSSTHQPETVREAAMELPFQLKADFIQQLSCEPGLSKIRKRPFQAVSRFKLAQSNLFVHQCEIYFWNLCKRQRCFSSDLEVV